MEKLITLLWSIKISLLEVIVFLLLIIILIFILIFIVKSIRNTVNKYPKKRMLKSIMLVISFILSFSFIISSIIFFYKTQMIRMLIPSVMGIILLLANIIIYILFFENNEVG